MLSRYLTLVSTLTVFLATGSFSFAQAQQQHRPVDLPSVAHAVSAPLRTFNSISHKEILGPARVIPLRRPEAAAGATQGGGAAGPNAPSVGNWSDADVQSTYNPSQLTLQKVFMGIGFTGQLPPDENLSVGINSTGGTSQTQIVQTVNTSFTIYTGSGTAVAGGYLNSLFANLNNSMCSSVNGGDPIVLFDKLDGRWIISQLAYNSTFTDNHLCMAISQTSDAGGAYDTYDFPFGSNLPDYPKLAVWPDGIYFSANIFYSNGTTQSFTGAQACSLPRSDVTNPPPSGNISFNCSSGTDASIYNILPADLENLPGTANLPSGHDYYLQYVDNLPPNAGNDLRLYQFDPTTGILNTVSDLTVNEFHDACGGGTCIPQEGTTNLLDSLGDRLMYRLSYRVYNGYSQIVANHSVQVNSSGNQTGIRWYILRSDQNGPFYVDKESTFSPDVSTYRWMASIAQNKDGDLALGYSTSGVTSVPGISVTGLLNGTDSGMELGQSIYNGSDRSYEGTYSRWGDYSSMSVDPTDDCSFWYTNEYIKTPVLSFDFLWNTVIGKLSFGNCSGSPAPSFGFTVNPPSSQNVTVGGSASYSITVTPSSGYNGIVSLSVDPTTCPGGATCSLSTTTADFSNSSTPVNTTLSVKTSSTTPAQSYNIVVKGVDTANSSISGQTSVQLTVQGTLSVTTSSLPSGTVGTAYNQTLAAGGGTTPYTWSLATGSNPLPAGLSLSNTGAITGTPSTVGSTTITAQVTDSSSPVQTATQQLTIQINPATLSVTTKSLPGGTVGTAYNQTLAASGGNTPYTWSISSGNLPNGLALNQTTGVISGSPNTAGTSTFTVQVTDSSSPVQTATQQLTIQINPTTLSVTTTSLPSGTVGTAYNQTLAAGGGTTPYTWSLATGSNPLPAGLLLSSSGAITGTPSTAGSSTFTAQVTDSSSPVQTATRQLTIMVADFSLSASSATIIVPVNSSNTDTITVTPLGNYTGSVSLSLTGLPQRTSSSFSINPISITSTSSGSSTLTISTSHNTTTGSYGLALTATDGTLSKTINLTLVVGTAPDFSISASPSSQTISSGSSAPYTVNISGSGGFTDSVTLSVSGLPSGASATFSTNPVTGGSGSPTMTILTTSGTTPDGTSTLTVTGTSSGGLIHSTTVTLVVGTAAGGDFSLSASPTSVMLHGGGTAVYTISVTPVSGANPTVGFQVTGLPSGATAGFNPLSVTGSGSTTMSVNVPSGVVGTSTLTIIGTNGQGTSHSVSVTLKLH